jgi:dimethylhistidine N-methyltransferase
MASSRSTARAFSEAEGLEWIATDAQAGREAFAQDVARGLTHRPKRLSCRYFYDAEGSRLFEAICDLPEYYLTRAERSILTERADAIAANFDTPISLVELGSGSSVKTRLLIEAFRRRHGTLRYVPVDISPTILEETARALRADYSGIEITAIAAEYEEGLIRLARDADRPRLVLWLGSNVGNFERSEAAAFLGRLRATLRECDRLLVGVDLRKERAILEAAYDDSQGVTARFNLNILARINRELGGSFDLGSFRHVARYDETQGRVEMHLESRRPQRVGIAALGLAVPFAPGERIHTENSYKYSLVEIDALAAAAGLRITHRWLDGDGRFSANLLAPR